MAYSVHTRRRLQTPDLTVRLLEAMARHIQALAVWYRQVQSRRAIEALSPEQLKDIGYPAVDELPSLEVEAGLMTRLQSMR